MDQELQLREWTISDIDQLVALAYNPQIAQFLDDGFPSPYNRESGLGYLQAIEEAEAGFMFRAIDLNGLAIGSIGLKPKAGIQRHVLEVGYWLGEPYWGQGIMSWAIREMCELGFTQAGIKRITAGVMEHNTGSQRVLEKAGFRQEARLEKGYSKYGQYYDCIVYALLHPDWRK